MLSPVLHAVSGTIGQMSRGSVSTQLANRFVGARLLRGLPLLSARPASQALPRPPLSKRTMASTALLEQARKDGAGKSAHSGAKLERFGDADGHRALSTRGPMSDRHFYSGAEGNIACKENPSASEIEHLVDAHGPVRLTMYGLHPQADRTSPKLARHTVLVAGVFRDDSGARIAIVLDGRRLTANPVKEFAENYASRYGKELHDLDHSEREYLAGQLERESSAPMLEQGFHRVINLDTAVDIHHMTIARDRNYIKVMQRDLDKEGLTYPIECFAQQPAEVAYDPRAGSDGKVPDEVVNTLKRQIKSDPSTIEAFVGFDGSGAHTDLFMQVPAAEKVALAPSIARKWRSLESVGELQNALRQEPTFAAELDKPESQRWLHDLFEHINALELPDGDKGIELIMHFPATYGSIAHLAIGSLWRDDEGALRMGILHQEAMPVTKTDWEGHVYPGFDTAKDCPTGRAPVAESIKLAGMPDIKASTTRYPDKLEPLAVAMSGADNAYPYGPGAYWSPTKGRFHDDRPFITCSSTTWYAHKVMNGKYPVDEPTLPDLFRGEFAKLNNTHYDSMKNLKIGNNEYSIDSIAQQPFEIAAQIFSHAGLNWGNKPWPVESTRTVKDGKIALAPGERQTLPQDAFPKGHHGAVFLNPKGLATADGKPAERNVFYPASEIAQMTVKVDKPGKLVYAASVDRDRSADDAGVAGTK